MKECFTEAVVLDKEPANESDARVSLYTKDLGRVTAKATSARKILSKLNSHLEPLNLIQIRLVQAAGGGNNWQVTDALRRERFSANFLPLLKTINELTAEGDWDYSLWSALLVLGQSNQPQLPLILKILGYDPQFAACEICQSRPTHFCLRQLYFTCGMHHSFCQTPIVVV